MKIENFHDFFYETLNIPPNLTLIQATMHNYGEAHHPLICSNLKVKTKHTNRKNMKNIKFSENKYFSCIANIVKLLCSESHKNMFKLKV